MSTFFNHCIENVLATVIQYLACGRVAFAQNVKKLHFYNLFKAGFLFALTAFCFSSCSIFSGESPTSTGLYFFSAKGDLTLDCLNEGKITNTIITKPGVRLSQKQIQHVFSTLHAEFPGTIMVDVGSQQNTVLFYDSQHRVVGVLRESSSAHEGKTPKNAEKF